MGFHCAIFRAAGFVSTLSPMQAVAPPPGGQRTSLTPPWPWPRAANETQPRSCTHYLKRKAPMATITLDKTTIKAGETAVVTFTVDISHMMGVTNRGGVRTVNDVTITGGTISAGYDFRTIAALSTPTTKVYQGTFTPTPNLDRTECTISYNPSGP